MGWDEELCLTLPASLLNLTCVKSWHVAHTSYSLRLRLLAQTHASSAIKNVFGYCKEF
jgi:hypothetical protein